MDLPLSVIICTHNPRMDYLRRTLAALKAQTLPKEQWELLLIDNASKEPLAGQWDLSWHPAARIIREEELGLTPARLRGIQEVKGELLVFVDDDNLLASNYLSVSHNIARRYPFMGVWGGAIEGEFEVPPADWAKPFLSMLAIREVKSNCWANFANFGQDNATMPFGAGMSVRVRVAKIYAEQTLADATAMNLGRKGNELTSGEDIDVALTCYGIDLATGLFSDLKLIHLIPVRRVQETYLLKLMEAMSYSDHILWSAHGRQSVPLISPLRFLAGRIKRRVLMSSRQRRFFEAKLRGQQRAVGQLLQAQKGQRANSCPKF